MGFDLMGRFGLIGLVTLVGLSIATPTTASELAKKNKTETTKAKQLMGTVLRAQQALYLENGTFAKSFKEFGAFRLNDLKKSTPSYRYKMMPSSQADKYFMVTAIPQRQGLPTYLGLVNVEELQPSKDLTTISILCHSTQAKAITPSWNMIAKPKPQEGFACPSGFKPVNQ
jgi:type IV pilus assembly protein PilA